MKFLLGVETIVAINDGGLGINYICDKGRVQWQPGGIRPVLSLEVLFAHLILTNQKAKRQKATRKDDPELPYQFAGQVFCEMLGQTCHKEFYDNIPGEYQEVPKSSLD
jgi:hypothetical protein